MPADRGCSLCDGLHYARGWCQYHYNRWYTTGTAAVPVLKTCSTKGLIKKVYC
jgi:hypothetical protein